MTEVRLFAALRDAAGSATVEVGAHTVAGMLAELGDRFGDVMQRRLAVASVIVDGEKVDRDDTDHDLTAATEVVLLPPFAGG
jgi:molybdopterin converting factor small subunit